MQCVKRFHYFNVCYVHLLFDLVRKQWIFFFFNFVRKPSKTEWCSSFIATAFSTDTGSTCTTEKVGMAKQTTQAHKLAFISSWQP